MKRLLLISLFLVSVFALTVSSASYRQFAALDKGLNPSTVDTVTITYNERIYAMHRVICGKGLDSVASFRITNYTNYTSFTIPAWQEWLRRGADGGGRTLVESFMLGSANVDNYLGACTDAQLEQAYFNRAWGAIKTIDQGK
jgi:hypothetical protein